MFHFGINVESRLHERLSATLLVNGYNAHWFCVHEPKMHLKRLCPFIERFMVLVEVYQNRDQFPIMLFFKPLHASGIFIRDLQ